LFDSHNHLQSLRFGRVVRDLVCEMKGVGVDGCVVNGTREDDWGRVREIAREYRGFARVAYGVHPWFVEGVKEGWDVRLREMLVEDEDATVGEVGLDGWVSGVSMELQREVFVRQVRIAVEMQRVMTVHCLKAWEELFDVMKEVGVWPEKFLMHSFGGSLEIAKRLADKGAWFSFSGYFLHERKRKVLEVFKQLSRDRILLETDAPEMMPPERLVKLPLGDDVNHPGNLARIAEEFERELGAGVLKQVEENGRVFWGL